MILKLLHLRSLVVLSFVISEARSQLLHRFLHCYYALCCVSQGALHGQNSLLSFIHSGVYFTLLLILVIHHDNSFGCHMFHNPFRGVAGAYPIILTISGLSPEACPETNKYIVFIFLPASFRVTKPDFRV